MLATLGAQNKILADLTVNADKVVGDLAANRKDVGRFVAEAKRHRAGLGRAPRRHRRRLPRAAGLPRAAAADDEGARPGGRRPGARRCATSTPRPSSSTTFFDQLGPFADASRPAFRSLGRRRRPATAPSRPRRRSSRSSAPSPRGTPELGKNLSIVLQHLDDRKHAVEKDPRSPGGQGYTGLEALLQYVYDQTTSTSIFDQNNHILKIGAFVGPCADYANEETLKKNPDLEPQCGSRLGPDPAGPQLPRRDQARRRRRPRTAGRAKRAGGDHDLPLPAVPAPVDAPAPRRPRPPRRPPTPSLPSVPTPSTPTVPTPTVPGVPPIDPAAAARRRRHRRQRSRRHPRRSCRCPSSARRRSSDPQAQTKLLDYLLKP